MASSVPHPPTPIDLIGVASQRREIASGKGSSHSFLSRRAPGDPQPGCCSGKPSSGNDRRGCPGLRAVRPVLPRTGHPDNLTSAKGAAYDIVSASHWLGRTGRLERRRRMGSCLAGDSSISAEISKNKYSGWKSGYLSLSEDANNSVSHIAAQNTLPVGEIVTCF